MRELGIEVKRDGRLLRHEELVGKGIAERRSCAGHYDLALDLSGQWWKWSHLHSMWMETESIA